MNDIVPLNVFRASIVAARPEDYSDALKDGARFAGITSEVARAEFAKMKSHLAKECEGMQPVESYRTASGQVVDCVPFDQQPSVRAAIRAGHTIARTGPPPLRITSPHATEMKLQPAQTREYPCPEGTVALLRNTLNDLLRFGTLDNFLRKGS